MRVQREGLPMINFTVGPVQSSERVRAVAADQVPYFRTDEFSSIMLENESLVKEFTGVGESGRVVFLTGSGTAAMEAVVINFFDENDKVLVVNGGGFGSRFDSLCQIHGIPHTSITLESGKKLTKEKLDEFDGKGYTGFLVNIHETSSGVYYDLDLISDFCKRNGIFLIVDAISSFLCDPLDMKKQNVNVMLTGSQKALACDPGISLIVMDPAALKRLETIESGCMYLDLKNALKNGERGQTPFTPAVNILRQINARLNEIKEAGGVEAEIGRISGLAEYFRDKIKDLPFELFSESMSSAVTALRPTTQSAKQIFLKLKDEYGIWVCPNGGDLEDVVFRVGHIGALTTEDYDQLLDAFYDLKKREFI